MSLQEKHKNNFDILRIGAAAAVILTHSYALLGFPEIDAIYKLTNGTTSFSRLGVWIFFIISGYLVTASALRSTSIKQYLTKRLLRIMPALIGVTLVTIILIGPLFTTISTTEYFTNPVTIDYAKNISVFKINYNLPGVFETNPYPGAVNGVLWTLRYELVWYVFPLLFILFGITRFLQIAVSIVAVTGALLYSVWAPLWGKTIPLIHIDLWHAINFGLFFLAGSMLYLYRDKIRYTLKGFLLAITLWLIGSWVGVGAIASFFTLPYIVLAIAHGPYIQIPSWVGDPSYGMYLYGFIVQQMLATTVLFTGNVAIFFITSLLISFIFAVFSWYIIEQPALRLKKRIIS